MRLLKLAFAAALAIGTFGALAIPIPQSTAEAQRHYRGDGHRWHGRHWCGDRHGHRRLGGRYCRRGDWRGRDSYRRRGRPVCHDVWRDGYRVPVCRY
jgi:hypothetical protein